MADLLPLDPDELLTTTRAVRKRLDLTRPVDRAVVEECIEIAMQAPSGSNRQTWQFVLVDDPDTKLALAEIYRSVFDAFRPRPRRRHTARTTPGSSAREAVNAPAKHLRDHYHEVPVLLVAFQLGLPDEPQRGPVPAGGVR